MIAAQGFRDTARVPQSPMYAADQDLVGLAESELDPCPATVTEHELEQQVLELHALNLHAQLRRVREAHGRLAFRRLRDGSARNPADFRVVLAGGAAPGGCLVERAGDQAPSRWRAMLTGRDFVEPTARPADTGPPIRNAGRYGSERMPARSAIRPRA